MSIFDPNRKREIREQVRRKQFQSRRGEIEGRRNDTAPDVVVQPAVPVQGRPFDFEKNKLGLDLLDAAIANNSMRASVLVHKGAQLDLTDGHGREPLMLFIQHKNHQLVDLLLSKGANPNSRDSLGRTPLMYAASEQLPDLCSILLMRGANPRLVDSNGCGVLHYCQGNQQLIFVLRQHGAA
jgi:ankyrin repeat protein